MSARWYRVKNKKVTGAAALSDSLLPGKKFRLLEIRLHLSAAVTAVEDISIKVKSGDGLAYDVNLILQAMNGVHDLVYRPNQQSIFDRADSIDVVFANTDSLTYGLEYVYQEV